MSGGQPRYASTPAIGHGHQHASHGASVCGTLTTARNILHHVILAQNVSRACCGIMCAEVPKGFFCDLHHMLTGKAREHDSCHEHHCLVKLLHVSCTAKAAPNSWEYSGLYAPDCRDRHEGNERTTNQSAARPVVQDYMMCNRS